MTSYKSNKFINKIADRSNFELVETPEGNYYTCKDLEENPLLQQNLKNNIMLEQQSSRRKKLVHTGNDQILRKIAMQDKLRKKLNKTKAN